MKTDVTEQEGRIAPPLSSLNLVSLVHLQYWRRS